jgi:hypothetical protein
MPFAQLVIGPPGSGKTTYCAGMQQFLGQLGRTVSVVNLDPGNEGGADLPYVCALNITDLVSLETVMDELELGPNGGMIYCLEHLEKNLEWFEANLNALPGSDASKYVVLDMPGQVELFTHHGSLERIVRAMQNWGWGVVAVNLVDANYCAVSSSFISAALLSLSTMLALELPHINVLSKVDQLTSGGGGGMGVPLPHEMELYTDGIGLHRLVDTMEGPLVDDKYRALQEGICDLVEEFGLVSFVPLNIEDKAAVARLVQLLDKAVGYAPSADGGAASATLDAVARMEPPLPPTPMPQQRSCGGCGEGCGECEGGEGAAEDAPPPNITDGMWADLMAAAQQRNPPSETDQV